MVIVDSAIASLFIKLRVSGKALLNGIKNSIGEARSHSFKATSFLRSHYFTYIVSFTCNKGFRLPSNALEDRFPQFA